MIKIQYCYDHEKAYAKTLKLFGKEYIGKRDIHCSIICIILIFNPIVQIVGMYRVCQLNKTTVEKL